ncbi:MAG: penicillin-binding transpeptidase domain-containing protein, partial [Candidatus Binatia bacterium]
GQVNGAIARRSPGSTLKPFLYARAIDEGRVAPDSFLLDVPSDFSGYVAENYDGRYRGRVTVREALVDSLNASAVRLLAESGLSEFIGLLRRGGLSTLDRPAAEYGLPILLGGGEVTLLDLTNLYAALAEGGLYRPVRLTEGPAAEPTPLFSAEAAELVTRILTEVKRPDLPAAWHLTRDVPQVAWKTGTSYGHRDAWAVGFSGRFSIGVWVGSFDGRGRKGISGAEHAGPILFDLFRAIEAGGARIPERPGLRIVPVEVCAGSHELPGAWCPARIAVPAIPGRTRFGRCALHRRVFVDRESGRLLAGGCLGRRAYRAEVITVFPAELMAWWRAQGQAVALPPPLHEDCRDSPSGDAPRIVSPGAATPYRIRADAPAVFQKIPLVARAAPTVGRLWWYENGELLAAAAPGDALFVSPARGRHRLVVVDDSGRS